ncbi:thioesterase family protein [Gordonia shandongensis]|uniref:thioesterase family protein n=1 Tax=Gordonia shandongensis TaxID=376351 RepID=UPI0003F756F2|nr:thioesterase family protein [Gordonia shandongensis]
MSLSTYETTVAREWIDYNGHLSEAFYVLVFGYATDTAMDVLGLDEGYRSRTGCSLYTVEAHVRYLREVGLAAPLTVTTEIVGVADKKLHIAHSMHSGETLVATEEIMALHVDQEAGRSVPMPDDVAAAARAAATAPAPWNGRSIGV